MEELELYLRMCYAKADDQTIASYIELLEEGEELPPTDLMQQYREKKKVESALNKEIESLRELIIAQKERLNCSFQLISIGEMAKNFFNNEVFYNWVAESLDPELLESVTIKSIDKKKLIKLEAQNLVDLSEVPPDLYDQRKEYTVRVSRKKVAED